MCYVVEVEHVALPHRTSDRIIEDYYTDSIQIRFTEYLYK